MNPQARLTDNETMARTMRRLGIAACVIVSLGVVAALWVRQSLAGGRLDALVETQLSAMLGQPVSIDRMDIELFPRVAVGGGPVRIGAATTGAPALQIAHVRLVPRLESLWKRPLVIERIELDGFDVSILRDRQKRWHVPRAVPVPTADERPGARLEQVRITRGRIGVFDEAPGGGISETARIQDIETEVAVEKGGLRLSPLSGRIGRALISGEARTDAATVRLSISTPSIADDDLPIFLKLLGSARPDFLHLPTGASASADVRVDRASSRLSGTGKLSAAQVLLGAVQLQRFESPFTVAHTRIDFNPMSFNLYGGDQQGNAQIQLMDSPATWTSGSRVKGLDVGDFLSALTGRDQRLDGTGSITAALQGRIGEPLERTLIGRTGILVTDGVVRDFPLMASINRALKVDEETSRDTRFERLSATFQVFGGQATTEDLVLESGDVRVAAQGRIGADRSIAMRGQAILSANRVARAVTHVRELARLKNSRGEIELPLTISGSLDTPSINVDLKAAIVEGIGDEIRRRLRRIIP
jgi:uncharacterized protein involved in outer membrane biogenesis